MFKQSPKTGNIIFIVIWYCGYSNCATFDSEQEYSFYNREYSLGVIKTNQRLLWITSPTAVHAFGRNLFS